MVKRTIVTAVLVALLRATLTHANSIAVVGATIIDGTGAIPKPDGVILVEGERFSAVGAAGKVAIPEGATRIDAKGKYVIPGLLDANVHLLLDVEAEPLVKYEGHYDDLIIEAAQLTLRNGVTTVFDTWGPRESLVRARDRVNHGESVGSRFFIGGNIIGFDGPFSSDFLQRGILSSEFVNRTNDAWEQGVGGDLLWRTPEQVGEHVRHYIARGGIDFLKYASSGHTQERLIAFSPEAQRAIVDEGRKAGLIVQAHSTSVESLRLEIAAGVNLMQHCDVTGPEPIPAATLKTIVAKRIPCAAMFSTANYAAWAKAHNIRENFSREVEVQQQNDRALITAKAVLALATDSGVLRPEARSNPQLSAVLAGVPDVPILLPDAQFLWLQAANELGMAPMDALLAATRNVAAAYGKLAELGTIERGKRADLVVLNADPLRSPQNYRAIDLVMKDGVVVDRTHLPGERFLTRPERNQH